MAIDFVCYTSCTKDDLDESIKTLSFQNKDIFTDKFLIYESMNIEEVDKEIASEFGLDAKTIFSISVNDKSAVELIPKVVDLVKNAIGVDRVVILFNNEILY